MQAHNFKDLSGQRFGMLTAERCVGVIANKTRWECRCDCGALTTKAYQHLALGLTRSCGCLRKAVSAKLLRARATTHGLSRLPWWQVWSGMMDRCYNTNFHRYHRYGGRGITVCNRWHDALSFHADMGDPPPGLTLERIDNDAGYSKDNCRWATYVEQNNNRRTTKLIEFDGLRLSGAAWARKVGISKAAMYERLRKWPVERALTHLA